MLQNIGWCSFFSNQIKPNSELLKPYRVIAIHKGACEVSDGKLIKSAKMTGKMRHEAETKLDYPTVGDWVLVKSFKSGELCQIEKLLHRQNVLKRKNAGRANNEQLIAANIDTAFIIQGLDPSFNLNRIERFVVIVKESRITPKIILTKTDLVKNNELRKIKKLIRERIIDVDIFMCSNVSRKGLKKVASLFVPAKTYCVIGPSGVGKSTLLNNLIGEDLLFTAPVNSSSNKGVHSTTNRELITLKNGANVIDTPGIRELGYLAADMGITETFSDINELAKNCLFKDCNHDNIKGCAIEKAVNSGLLDRKRYLNYLKLKKESFEYGKSEIEKRENQRNNNRFHNSSIKNK